MKTWSGKRVLITGAAAGIGRALAVHLGGRGAHLVLADRDAGALAGTAAALRSGGGSVQEHVLDVTDPAAVLRVRDEVHARGGPIDVLVNNAGVVHGGAFLSIPLERHLQTLQVNAAGVVAVTHAFLPDLVARPEAHLVNMGSASGYVGVPFASTYAASKWFVIGLSESIRAELAEQGQHHVKVTTVCPLYVSTGMFEGARPPRGTAMLSPGRLAAQIVEAVEKDRVFLRTPWLVEITPLLVGLLPVRWADLVSKAFGVTGSMQAWTGHRADEATGKAVKRAG